MICQAVIYTALRGLRFMQVCCSKDCREWLLLTLMVRDKLRKMEMATSPKNKTEPTNKNTGGWEIMT